MSTKTQWSASSQTGMTSLGDIEITYQGIALLYGLTEVGIEWLKRNVAYEQWQLICGGIACEPNMARDLAVAAENDGLTVL